MSVSVFFASHLISSPFFSLSHLLLVSDPGSHSRLFPPPSHYGSCLAFFYREKTSALSSLVDSRRNAKNKSTTLARWAFSAEDTLEFEQRKVDSNEYCLGLFELR